MTNSTVVLTYEQPAAKQGNVIKVTGTVKDSSGEPLAGAGVLVKGTTIGTNTNLDGKYSIEVTPTMSWNIHSSVSRITMRRSTDAG